MEAAALRIECRHGARTVDTDQPVSLGAAARGIGQRQHFFIGTQVGETLADRALGHRLQPQATDRLVGFGVLRNVAKNQLALAARVASIDQADNILALDQAVEQLQAVGGLLDRIQGEMRRNHRQVGERPFATLDLVFFWNSQFEQMANGRREDVVLALEMIAFLGEAAQRLGDVVGDGRFFSDD